jgi:LPXTG-site transpeptidase (sortase) family protein
VKYKGKLVATLFLGTGIFLILQVILPLASFKVWEIKNIKSDSLLVSPDRADRQSVLGVSIQSEGNFPAIISSLGRRSEAPFSYFYLTVPKLNLKNVQVVVDSNDLSKTLAHLPGSALPGEKGNIFISGHSMLPQFEKGNTAYFASLTELAKGDVIKVSAQSGEFNYQVVGMKVVDPKDLSVIIAPDTQYRYITLMTCVPPGLNTKRLVVLGKAI